MTLAPRSASRLAFAAVACCAMVCGTFLARPVSGSRQAGDAAAAVIAVIDLERVFGNLDAFERANRDVEAFAESLRAQVQTKQEELQLKNEEVDLVSGAQRDAKLAEVEEMADELRVFLQWAELRVERRRVDVLRDQYFAVRAAAATLSEANDWDMVLVDDSKVVLPLVDTRQDMMRQISARRMIYTNSRRIDVTDVLIEVLNAAPAAGSGE